MKTKVFLTAMLVFIMAIAIPGKISAQGTSQPAGALSIYPSIFELNSKVNAVTTEEIMVKNNSNLAIPVQIEMLDYTVDEQGTPSYFTDSERYSAKSWVTVTPSDLILNPNEERTLSLKFTVPENALPGSHFATILFKPTLPPSYFTAESVHVVGYIGAIAAINIASDSQGQVPDYLVIRSVNVVENKEQSNKLAVEKVISNKDYYYHKVDGRVKVTDLFGNTVEEVPFEDLTLLPDKTLSVENELNKTYFIGRFKVETYINDGNLQAVQTTYFDRIPIPFISLVMISLILFFFMFKYRIRIMKSIRVLVASN
jgi:hypothetical protein